MKILSDWIYTTPGGFPFRAVEFTSEEWAQAIPLDEYLAQASKQDSSESKVLCSRRSDK
jgi:hypothetical protein